ncbi:hypothetical protein DLJ47_04625 [Micromonospora sp. S4605]|nr:hypothetical protein DLJ47_04625 [Micromonospora sp. S4605]
MRGWCWPAAATAGGAFRRCCWAARGWPPTWPWTGPTPPGRASPCCSPSPAARPSPAPPPSPYAGSAVAAIGGRWSPPPASPECRC